MCLLTPGRFVALQGPVNWTEQGFFFAWRVMLIEKTGHVSYRLVERSTGREWRARPTDRLTEWQHEQMRTQPDHIVWYARHLADEWSDRGHDVAVYANSWAALNGRRSQRLVRPDLDLTQPLPRDFVVPLRPRGAPRGAPASP
jgi:hypothetical protein